MAAIDTALQSQLAVMGAKLARRANTERILDRYYDGKTPLPTVITTAQITKAYAMLMGQSTAPWGSIVVDSVLDRLEVTGIDSGDQAIDSALWGVWQDQQLDSESQLAHTSALISGRMFGLVWPDEDTGQPEISLDNSAQMIIKYREGSRRKREAAMRYWMDDATELPFANLYLPDGIYKFQGTTKDVQGPDGIEWLQRDVSGEDWPVDNPFNIVPVVELAVNRRLKPGCWGFARGEFEHVTAVIDRINLLTFLGLVVAFWQGFPVRGVIGDRILRDDNNNPLPPFQAGADQVVQLENPDAKFVEFAAADRGNLSIFNELDQLASLTKTPMTYFPRAGAISNISADTIRALEGGLVAKIPKHKATLGEGWEELLRISGMMLDEPVDLSQRAELIWSDHENRSLAERADAAVKLTNILPPIAIAEYVLNLTAEQLARIQAMRAGDALSQLLAAVQQPATAAVATPTPAPAATQNGGGG